MTETSELAATVAEFSDAYCEQLNVTFEDAVLLVGRVLGGFPTATAARATRVELAGIHMVVTDHDRDHAWFAEFDAPIGDVTELNEKGLELVLRAREVSGEDGVSTAERKAVEMQQIRTFFTSVRAVHDVHPHLRRITFGGGGLEDFAPLGPDTFLYVLLPPPGRTELTIDESFSWADVPHMPVEEQPVGAYYTLREWRPETGELDMLFVLHGDSGPASAWAMGARPGDPVALWGPRQSWDPPATSQWYLLLADDTGLPAVARILEVLPDDVPVHVIAEVEGAAEQQELPPRPGTTVEWLHRCGVAAGTSSLLADAARAWTLPAGDGYVWGGAESRAMTAVRKYLRQERGLPREAVMLSGYWRHGQQQRDAATDDDD